MNYLIFVFLIFTYAFELQADVNDPVQFSWQEKNILEIAEQSISSAEQIQSFLPLSEVEKLSMRDIIWRISYDYQSEALEWFITSSFPNLKQIAFSGEGLSAISGYFSYHNSSAHFADHAQSINIDNAETDPLLLKYLITLPSLKKLIANDVTILDMYDQSFSDRDDYFLENLEVVKLDNLKYHTPIHRVLYQPADGNLPFSPHSAPNIKELSLRNSRRITSNKHMQMIAKFTNLELLDLSMCLEASPPPRINVKVLDKLHKLKSLSLSGWYLEEESDFGCLSSLEILDLSNSENLSSSIFNTLFGLENLKKLDLTGIRFSFIPFEAIRHFEASFPNCEVLYSGKRADHDPTGVLNYAYQVFDGFQEIINQVTVKELDLSYVSFSNKDKLTVFFEAGHFPLLKELNLSYPLIIANQNPNQITVSLEQLGSFAPNLEILTMRGIDFLHNDLKGLASLPILKILDLSDATFSYENIEQTQYTSLESLEEMRIENSNIRGTHFDSLSPNLIRLSLKNSNITAADLARIGHLKNLQYLNVEGTNITSASIKKLGSLTFLTELSLAGTNMIKADFSHLPYSLSKLDLSKSILSLACFNTLKELKQLTILDLRAIRNGNITLENVQQLQMALPNCQILF